MSNGYGMFCCNCPARVNAPTQGLLDQKTATLKWCIGLDLKAQAHYACPECAPLLIDPRLLYYAPPQVSRQ